MQRPCMGLYDAGSSQDALCPRCDATLPFAPSLLFAGSVTISRHCTAVAEVGGPQHRPASQGRPGRERTRRHVPTGRRTRTAGTAGRPCACACLLT